MTDSKPVRLHGTHFMIGLQGVPSSSFLSSEILTDDKGINKWIHVFQAGSQTRGKGEPNIFRSDIVARDHPVFKGLSKGVLRPDIYGELLKPKARFSAITVPDDVVAVWINLILARPKMVW